MIRLLLCDDQLIVTEGLRIILRSASDIQVVGIAHDGAEAIDLAAQEHPDIVLMDLRMPVMNGIQATREISKRFPAIRVLILTTYDDDEWVLDAIRGGAAGYLLKDTPREQLIAAIRGTVAGTAYLDPNVAGKVLKHVANPVAQEYAASSIGDNLSERELDILRLVADGLSNAEIAERLHLSKGTVQNYMSNILAKLDVTDRTQAAILALRYGLAR